MESHPSDLSGLKNFKDYYGKKVTTLVIYRGEKTLTIDGVAILSIAKAIELIFA